MKRTEREGKDRLERSRAEDPLLPSPSRLALRNRALLLPPRPTKFEHGTPHPRLAGRGALMVLMHAQRPMVKRNHENPRLGSRTGAGSSQKRRQRAAGARGGAQ